MPSSFCFDQAMMLSLDDEWKWVARSCWRAGWRRRIAFNRVTSGAIDPASSQLRCFTSYFSDQRYSSLLSEAGTFSQSS